MIFTFSSRFPIVRKSFQYESWPIHGELIQPLFRVLQYDTPPPSSHRGENLKKKKLSKLFIVTWNQHYWFKKQNKLRRVFGCLGKRSTLWKRIKMIILFFFLQIWQITWQHGFLIFYKYKYLFLTMRQDIKTLLMKWLRISKCKIWQNYFKWKRI
jgi:hypothetical protein